MKRKQFEELLEDISSDINLTIGKPWNMSEVMQVLMIHELREINKYLKKLK